MKQPLGFLKNGEAEYRYLTMGNPKANKVLIALHGFTGAAEDFQPLFCALNDSVFCIAVDLPGHGKTKVPYSKEYYEYSSLIDPLKKLIHLYECEHKELFLLGYSMGGRYAIWLQQHFKFRGCILISSTPGIIDEESRRQRRNDDLQKIKLLKDRGVHSFLDYWNNLPLIATQKNASESIQSHIRKTRSRNNAEGLILSLQHFGTGQMPSYWKFLPQAKPKFLLCAGESDHKFLKIMKQMNQELTSSSFLKIPCSGHGIHFENPVSLRECIWNFIQ